MTLDLSIEENPKHLRPVGPESASPTSTAREAESGAAQEYLPTAALRTCLALVTAMLPDGDIDSDLVGAILLDEPQEDLLEMAFATAWFAAGLIRHLDDVLDGDGTLWLRSFAATLAQEPFSKD